jgi:TetR/AcrR family acrAB operon transcriptional repressor
MVKKTREEALETRTLLLDTAEQVFHRKGVAQTTLCDIASVAGLTRGAIYWHFKNKGDLFNAMCDRVSLPLETMTEAAAAADVEDPLGELRKSVQFFFHKVTHDEHYRLVFDILFSKCEFVAELGPIVERDARVREQFMHRFERTFGNAEKRGQLPKGLNHRLAVHCYQGLVKGIVRNWLLDPNSFDLEADGSRMLEAFFEMLQVSTALRDQSVGKGSKKK